MKVFVGITGSSGVHLGLRLLNALASSAQVYCAVSKGAKLSFEAETNTSFEKALSQESALKDCVFFDDENLSASVSSGSFGIEKSIIAPCSINTLAKIHAGLCDSLITRAAAVALKERKTLVLGVREMPFSTISLEHMAKLSALGASIAPPVYASYFRDANLEALQDFITGKWLDLLGIKHDLFQRWQS